MARARKLCPQALIVPPRFDRYQEVSRQIMDVFGAFSPSVEALSLDEAFIDMTGAEGIFGGPEAMGRRIKAAVREATGGLTVTVGISGTKYVAKVASGYRKPDGLTIVPADQAQAWLAPLPVSHLWGAGPKTEARLRALGLDTIGDVARADPDWLAENLGGVGRHFHALAQARDPRRVEGRRSSKSVGSETTLPRDICDRTELKQHLRRAADQIGRRLRKKRIVAFGVRVKLKTHDFQILTRQHHFREPTDLAQALYTAGARLLDGLEHPGPFRLVGLAAYDLDRTAESAQGDLFGEAGDSGLASGARRRRLETAIDAITERFGGAMLRPAEELTQGHGPRLSVNLDFIDEESDG